MSDKNVLAQALDEIKQEAETAIAAVEAAIENGAKIVYAAVKPIVEADLAAFFSKFKTLATNLIVNVLKAGVEMVQAKSISIVNVLQAAQAAGQSFTSDLYSMAVALVEQVAIAVATVLTAKLGLAAA